MVGRTGFEIGPAFEPGLMLSSVARTSAMAWSTPIAPQLPTTASMQRKISAYRLVILSLVTSGTFPSAEAILTTLARVSIAEKAFEGVLGMITMAKT